MIVAAMIIVVYQGPLCDTEGLPDPRSLRV